jgi:subtilisin family serine protease
MTNDKTFKYDALWHLDKIGLNLQELKKIEQIQKDESIKIALFDTSVAIDHPCLANCIDLEHTIDFIVHKNGHRPYKKNKLNMESINQKIANFLSDFSEDQITLFEEELGLGKKITTNTSEQNFSLFDNHALDEKYSKKNESSSTEHFENQQFSAHGTAIAGILAGRPAKIKNPKAVSNSDDETEFVLPFRGVNPFCKLVPVMTSFDPDPAQFILALLYAEAIDVNLIVIPRDFPNPWLDKPPVSQKAELVKISPKDAKNLFPERIKLNNSALWDLLTDVLIKISKTKPIVCSAGNSGDANVIYPACLAALKDNNIISVGAVDHLDRDASYSIKPTDNVDMVTMCAYSNNIPIYNSEQTIIDAFDDNLEEQKELLGKDFNEPEILRSILSTDVPGPFGYNGSHQSYEYLTKPENFKYKAFNPNKLQFDPSSYFCRFGGTSAAVAITGGIISLAMTTNTDEPNKIWNKKDLLEQFTHRSDNQKSSKLPIIKWKNDGA